jgi:hypothetical protein
VAHLRVEHEEVHQRLRKPGRDQGARSEAAQRKRYADDDVADAIARELRDLQRPVVERLLQQGGRQRRKGVHQDHQREPAEDELRLRFAEAVRNRLGTGEQCA